MLLAQLPGILTLCVSTCAARQGRWKETARDTRLESGSILRNPTLDHWHHWTDLRLKDEVPPDQRAYLDKIIQRLLLCRDPDGGYALYVCPGCEYELRVPFSCKTRFCPSCGKVRVDEWVNRVADDLLDVPHLHVTLTTDDLLWPFFHTHRSLLKVLLKTASQAVRELVADLYPSVRIGLVHTTHTFGRDLGFKPHVHLVMTKGGLKDGEWVEFAASQCAPKLSPALAAQVQVTQSVKVVLFDFVVSSVERAIAWRFGILQPSGYKFLDFKAAPAVTGP
jgi:hypothetical protein